MKTRGLIAPQTVQDFGHIRGARKPYLHYWTSIADERTAREAVEAYACAIRLVLSAVGFNLAEGRAVIKVALAEYLKARGALKRPETVNGATE